MVVGGMVKLSDITTKPQKIKIPVFRSQKKFNRWYINVYLKSPHWIAFALWMKFQHPYCADCNTEGTLHTHHETYTNLGKETEDDCRNLCEICHTNIHALIHDLGFATERELWEQNRK